MKLRILVIDDEECIRDSFKWHLESLGHEVITSDRPEHCPVYAGHDCDHDAVCADLLIVDYHMSDLNGLDFIARLRQHGCKVAPHRVMLLTASPAEVDHERAQRLGCLLRQKPLRLAELEAWVEECASTIHSGRQLADLDAAQKD